jgi:hypothetical protein
MEHEGSMPQNTILSKYNPKQSKCTCNHYYQAFWEHYLRMALFIGHSAYKICSKSTLPSTLHWHSLTFEYLQDKQVIAWPEYAVVQRMCFGAYISWATYHQSKRWSMIAVNGSTAKEIQVSSTIRITYQARTESCHSVGTAEAI